MPTYRSKNRLLLVLPLLAAGCASSGSKTQQEAPTRIDDLVTMIERVHTEAKTTRERVAEAFARLQTLAAADFKKEDARTSYARFVQAIDDAERQAALFKEALGPMKAAAAPVFTKWEKDLQAIAGESLRKRSQMRFALTKERFNAVIAASDPVQSAIDGFHAALRDHALFLGNDLNAGSIEAIQDDVKVVARTARELDRNLDSCQMATRAYVDFTALPDAAATAAKPDGK